MNTLSFTIQFAWSLNRCVPLHELVEQQQNVQQGQDEEIDQEASSESNF